MTLQMTMLVTVIPLVFYLSFQVRLHDSFISAVMQL